LTKQKPKNKTSKKPRRKKKKNTKKLKSNAKEKNVSRKIILTWKFETIGGRGKTPKGYTTQNLRGKEGFTHLRRPESVRGPLERECKWSIGS